eukprot:400118_1
MELLVDRSRSINYENTSADILNRSFKWLNPFMLYLPLWVTKWPLQQPRSSCCNALGISITILLNISPLYIMIAHFNNDSGDNIISQIYYLCLWITGNLCRTIAIHYYYKHFDYPWSTIGSILVDTKSLNIIKWTKWRLKLYITLFFILQAIELYSYYHVYSFQLFMSWALMKIMEIPTIITQCVISVLFLKYRLNILYLISLLENPNFRSILNQYYHLWNSMKKSYVLSLQMFYFLLIFAMFCNTWLRISQLVQNFKEEVMYNGTSFIVNILVVMEFLISASGVAKSFEMFTDTLIDMHISVEIESSSINIKDAETIDYHHLLLFMFKKPLKISMFGMDITQENALKFTFVFVIAKFVSYSVYSL